MLRLFIWRKYRCTWKNSWSLTTAKRGVEGCFEYSAKPGEKPSPGGGIWEECGLMQRFCRTDLCALIAENALCSVFPLTGLFVGLYIHGADPQTFAAVNAFVLIAVNAQQ